MLPWLSFVVFLGLLHGGVLGLVLRNVEEGSCRTIHSAQSEDVDPIWLDALPYITGGSKFHLYGLARGHPRFSQMREAELYYEACYTKNTSIIEGTGTIFGFGGRIMGSYTMRRSKDRNNLVDVIPNNPTTGQPGDFFRQKVTLTDYKTFAVMVNCWVGPDQRSWDVYSMLPEMHPATERLIEDHVKSLGFKEENIVFLRRGNCPREMPLNSGGNQGGNQQRPGGNPGHQQRPGGSPGSHQQRSGGNPGNQQGPGGNPGSHQQRPGGNPGNQQHLGGNYGDKERSEGMQGGLRRPEWNRDDQKQATGNQGGQHHRLGVNRSEQQGQGENLGSQQRPDWSQKELRRPELNQGNQPRSEKYQVDEHHSSESSESSEWSLEGHHRSGGNQRGHQRPEGSQSGSGASGGSIKRGIPSGGAPSLKNIIPAGQGPKVLPAKEKCLGRGCNTGGSSVHSTRSGSPTTTSTTASPGLGWTQPRSSTSTSTTTTASPRLGWSQPGSSTSTTTTTASPRLGWSAPASSTTTTMSPGLGWTGVNTNN